MASTINKYRIWCVTEETYVYTWAESEPTVCPNNNTHVIDESKTAITETVSQDLVKDSTDKPFYHQTSRPLGLDTYFTSRSDDISNIQLVGGGSSIAYIAHVSGSPDPDPVYLDLNIADNRTFIHEGYLSWTGFRGDLCKLEIVPIVTSATVVSGGTDYVLYGGYLVIPASGGPGTGNLQLNTDLTEPRGGLIYVPDREGELGTTEPVVAFWNATWNPTTHKYEDITPAPYGNGHYNIFTYEVVMSQFVNDICLNNDGFTMLQSSDTAEIGQGMRIKLKGSTNTNVPDHSWSYSAILTLHRARTI